MARILLSQLTNDWPSVVRSLTGEGVTRGMEEAAIAAITRDMEREDLEDADLRADAKRTSRESWAIARELLGKNERVADIARLIRPAIKKWDAWEPPIRGVEREEASVAVGSLTATLVPPYAYSAVVPWNDGPAVIHTEARKSDGYLYTDVGRPDNDDAWDGKAAVFVGVPFKPAFDGQARLGTTVPSIISFWYTSVAFADAWTAGKIGVSVYRFINGQQDPPNASYAHNSLQLWTGTSQGGLGGVGPHSEVYSPSVAVDFNASRDHDYALWAYFKAGAGAGGGGLLFDSGARAEMNAFVPHLKWKLTT
jgi:hypothetical protein